MPTSTKSKQCSGVHVPDGIATVDQQSIGQWALDRICSYVEMLRSLCDDHFE